MSRSRGVWRALAAFAGAAVLVAGASAFANQSTGAVWTDQVGFTTTVTADDFATSARTAVTDPDDGILP